MFPCYFRTFKLGGLYETDTYPRRIVKFIKVTRKGYNLLDIETNKCILRYKCKDNQICQGTQGDERWSKFISKEAIDFINYELVEKKKKPLTPSEERQVFDFYFNGDTLGLKEEIKKHREEIKKLKEKLKNG